MYCHSFSHGYCYVRLLHCHGTVAFVSCFTVGSLFCWWHRSAGDQLGGYQEYTSKEYTSMYILRCDEHLHDSHVAQCRMIMIQPGFPAFE